VVLFAPWVRVLLQQQAALAIADAGMRPGAQDPGTLGLQLARIAAQVPNLLLTYQVPIPDALAVAVWVGVAVLVVLRLRRPADTIVEHLVRGLAGTFAAALILILVTFVSRNVFLQERYLFLLLPAGWVLIATGLDQLGLPVRRGLALGYVLLMLLAIGGILPTLGEDFRGAARQLAMEVQPGEPVYVIAPFCTAPLAWYWPAGRDRLSGVTGFDPQDTNSQAGIAEGIRGRNDIRPGRAIWLVVSHDQRGTTSRGGGQLAVFLTQELGEPIITRYAAVTVHRFAFTEHN
jgi:hypothetical protein